MRSVGPLLAVATAMLTTVACAGPEPVVLVAADTIPPALSVEPVEPDTTDSTSEQVTDPVPTSSPVTTSSPGAVDVDERTRIITTAEFDDIIVDGGGRTGAPGDDLVAAATVDIANWMAFTVRDVYQQDQSPLRGGVHAVHRERRTPAPDCAGVPTEYRDMLDYVALYCPTEDFIAYDAGSGGLLGALNAEWGPMATAVVIAHEFGHAIQERVGVLDRPLPTIILEQHADCLAGAWMGWDDPSRSVQPGRDAVLTALVALIEVRDPVGVDPFSPGGHGTAFDRIGAFTHGYIGGSAACVPLIDEPLEVMPNRFGDLDDLARGGNAPYDCSGVADPECRASYEFLGDDLNEFWSLALDVAVAIEVSGGRPTCDNAAPIAFGVATCSVDRSVWIDESVLRPIYDDRGDFVLGFLLGLAWAQLLTDPAEIDQICAVGAWIGDLTLGRGRNPERASTVVTSPGDIDEAVDVIMSTATDGVAALDEIARLRTGVLTGVDACSL